MPLPYERFQSFTVAFLVSQQASVFRTGKNGSQDNRM